MAEVFAPSWWPRRRSFIHRHKNHAKNRFTCGFRLFITGTCLGFAPLRGTCAARRFFRRNHRKKEEKSRKKATSTGRGRWSCGGLRRAALEVTAVFCGHGRWFILEVFIGFSIWRLKRHNLPFALVAEGGGAQRGGCTWGGSADGLRTKTTNQPPPTGDGR